MKCTITKVSIFVFSRGVLFALFFFLATFLYAQQYKVDSLVSLIAITNTDTGKIDLYEKLGDAYRSAKKMDSSILSFQLALDINKKNNYSVQHQCWNMAAMDYILFEMGNYLLSLTYAENHLKLSEQLNDTSQKGAAHLVFGHDYRELGNYRQSLDHYFKAFYYWNIFHVGRHEEPDNIYTLLCIALTYLKMNKPDSALFYANQRFQYPKAMSVHRNLLLAERISGDIYLAKGDDETALKYYRDYLPDYTEYEERNRDLCFVLNNMARIFIKRNQTDSAVFYAKMALTSAGEYQDQQNIYDAAKLLSDLYEPGHSIHNDELQAFKYFRIAEAAKDSMANIEKIRQIQLLSFNEKVREKEQQDADAREAAKERMIIIISAILVVIVSFLIWYRIKQLRLKYKTILEQKEAEKLKTTYEKKMLELESKALRAQMNPHFIFNCLNSIKALVQKKDEDKAITYLTTFSKLIRTIFQNSDKREITLYDEMETCRLYTQLESMRFGNKFNYSFAVDNTIDLKSVMVPALIIQPFIENAIWHGIMPKEDGGYVNVTVNRLDENICCMIDDNGIGREISRQNKFKGEPSTHQSKGVHLTQSRLDLNNLINERSASLEVIDKKDDEGKAAGTAVVVKFREI